LPDAISVFANCFVFIVEIKPEHVLRIFLAGPADEQID
jgi:hypothetical protein